jgi:hypothetical protein
MNRLSGASKKCVLLSTWHINIGKFTGWFHGSCKDVPGVLCLHICIIMYSPKEVTYNPNMLSIYLLKSMAFPQSSS